MIFEQLLFLKDSRDFDHLELINARDPTNLSIKVFLCSSFRNDAQLPVFVRNEIIAWLTHRIDLVLLLDNFLILLTMNKSRSAKDDVGREDVVILVVTFHQVEIGLVKI